MEKKYIDADLVLAALYECDADVMADYGPEYGTEWGFSRTAVENVVSSIPAANVAPAAHGEWIKSDLDDECVTCSNCKKLKLGNRRAFTPIAFKELGLNYCPNCGADMRQPRAK